MLLHEKIRKLREFKDLSQHYVARRLNISQEAYSNWENGRARLTLDKLRAIAEALEVNPINIIELRESSLYRSLHGKATPGTNDHPESLHDALTPNERHLFEQRSKELQDALNWQRQQNELLTKQLALFFGQNPHGLVNGGRSPVTGLLPPFTSPPKFDGWLAELLRYFHVVVRHTRIFRGRKPLLRWFTKGERLPLSSARHAGLVSSQKRKS